MKRLLIVAVFAVGVVASARASWTTVAQGSGSDLNRIAFASDQIGIALGNDGLVLRTVDGGATWQRMTMPQNVNFTDIAFPSYGVMVAVGERQFNKALVGISYDSGENWWLSNVDAFPPISSVTFVSPTVGFATAMNSVMRTNDGGMTWTSTDVGGSYLLSSIRFTDALHGVVSGGRHDEIGFTMHTADGGLTWTSDSNGYCEPIVSVHNLDAQHQWCAGGDFEYGAFLSGSNDGGTTWTQTVFADLKTALNDILFTDAQHGVAVGSKFALQTIDGGAHWSQSAVLSDGYLTSLAISPRGDVWAVGSNGVIMKQTQSPNGVVSGIAIPSMSLMPNYPNPVSSSTEFRFTLAEQTHATLSVFSIDGASVATVVNEVLDAGDHTAQWNANDASGKMLPNGTYLVKLTAGENTVTNRLTIVR